MTFPSESTTRLNLLAMLGFPFIWWDFVDPWASYAENDNGEADTDVPADILATARFGLRTGAPITMTSQRKSNGEPAQ